MYISFVESTVVVCIVKNGDNLVPIETSEMISVCWVNAVSASDICAWLFEFITILDIHTNNNPQLLDD